MRLSLLLAALGVAATAGADPPLQYPAADVDPRWPALVARGPTRLARDAVPLATACPTPAVLRVQAGTLVALQKARTPAQLQSIRAEAPDVRPLFFQALGVTRAAAPATAALVDLTTAEVDWFLFAQKLALMCPRPHQVDKRLTPAIPVPKHPSYPSGHAGEAAALARVAAALAPERRSNLDALAAQIARHREVAGVHFAADSVEGARIGRAVADALLALRVPELEAARAELARLRGHGGLRNTGKHGRKVSETRAP